MAVITRHTKRTFWNSCGYLILWIFFSIQGCYASWMHLGVASLAGSVQQRDDLCDAVPGLVYEQIQVCQRNPESLFCVGQGARQGILECQRQFRFERWNCTTNSNHSVFGPLLKKGTRETAFIYAVLSAGVVHSVTQACSVGNLTECTCDMSRHGEENEEAWKWGGCSDNVEYGVQFSRTFVDAPDQNNLKRKRSKKNKRADPGSKVASSNTNSTDTDGKDSESGPSNKKERKSKKKKKKKGSGGKTRSLMNLHNNEVGRKMVEQLMTRKCRCHGVSGSCAVMTCWRGLPPFLEIGQALKVSYEKSVRLAARSRRHLRRKERRRRREPITQTELVHLRRSPNFCRSRPGKGILGTQGRICNRTAAGPESCDLLCCGRGYNTQVVRHVERCNCKFHWCCYVECERCESYVDVHTCK